MVFVWIVFGLAWGCVWGYATQTVNENKGYEGGFWLGFFLGFIGLLIVLCKSEKHSYASDYESSMLAQVQVEEINKRTAEKGGWKCTCGRINSNYVGTCACGKTRYEIVDAPKRNAEREEAEKKAAEKKKDEELRNIELLKSYKDLLDSGVISQEEFDAKKEELLKK